MAIDVETLAGRTGTTTHGKQLGVNYIIKAVQVGVPQDVLNAMPSALIKTKTVNATSTPSGNIGLSVSRNYTVIGVLIPDSETQYICIPWYDPNGRNWYAHIEDGTGTTMPNTTVTVEVRYI